MCKAIAVFGLVLLSAACGGKSGSSLPLEAGITDKLARSAKTTSFWIDNFGDRRFPFAGASAVTISSVNTIAVVGWAIDEPNVKAAAGVEIVLDGKPYRARYGISRSDVATAKGNPAYTDSGFEASFPGASLDKGAHTFSIRIIAAHHSSYYTSPTWSVVVD